MAKPAGSSLTASSRRPPRRTHPPRSPSSPTTMACSRRALRSARTASRCPRRRRRWLPVAPGACKPTMFTRSPMSSGGSPVTRPLLSAACGPTCPTPSPSSPRTSSTARPALSPATSITSSSTTGRPAFALFDYDSKGKPAAIEVQDFWKTLLEVVPAMRDAGRVTRHSTSVRPLPDRHRQGSSGIERGARLRPGHGRQRRRAFPNDVA